MKKRTAKAMVMRPLYRPRVEKSKRGRGSYKRVRVGWEHIAIREAI